MILSVILVTTLFYKALIFQGEIWCWSLLGFKGLNVNFFKIWSSEAELVMMNYACAFSQSESGNYFEWIIIYLIFFQACERAESSKICNLIGSESGRYFTILPANPGGIVGSFIHKFLCSLWMSKHLLSFSNHFSYKTWALTGKSKFYYSNEKTERRIKQFSEENR